MAETFLYQGKHLLVDAACQNHDALVNLRLGQDCLEALVESIGMTMVLPPVGVKFPNANGELHRVLKDLEAEGLGQSQTAKSLRQQLHDRAALNYGYSTFVMIAESHVSLHTFPEGQFLTFDCYSCRDFDHRPALEVLDRFFSFKPEPKIQVVDRPFEAALSPQL